MNNSEWLDETSYSRGQRGKIDPQTWTLRFCGIRLHVTRRIHCDGPWFACCHDLSIDQMLRARELEEAKQEAVGLVRSFLENTLSDLNRVCDQS